MSKNITDTAQEAYDLSRRAQTSIQESIEMMDKLMSSLEELIESEYVLFSVVGNPMVCLYQLRMLLLKHKIIRKSKYFSKIFEEINYWSYIYIYLVKFETWCGKIEKYKRMCWVLLCFRKKECTSLWLVALLGIISGLCLQYYKPRNGSELKSYTMYT